MLPDVYILLTSIPSRVARILTPNVRHLAQQDYGNVKHIVVTVPTVNMRGQASTGKEDTILHALEAEHGGKVIVHRPAFDHGPIMKYIGGVQFVPDRADVLVFVCDDDQAYALSRVSELVAQWFAYPPLTRARTVISNHTRLVLNTFDESFRSVFGAYGVLMPATALHAIARGVGAKTLRCCALNDDIHVGLLLHKAGYSIRAVLSQASPFQGGEPNHEESDALHTMHSYARKLFDMYHCHWSLNRERTVGLLILFGLLFVFVAYCLVFLGLQTIRAIRMA